MPGGSLFRSLATKTCETLSTSLVRKQSIRHINRFNWAGLCETASFDLNQYRLLLLMLQTPGIIKSSKPLRVENEAAHDQTLMRDPRWKYLQVLDNRIRVLIRLRLAAKITRDRLLE